MGDFIRDSRHSRMKQLRFSWFLWVFSSWWGPQQGWLQWKMTGERPRVPRTLLGSPFEVHSSLRMHVCVHIYFYIYIYTVYDSTVWFNCMILFITHIYAQHVPSLPPLPPWNLANSSAEVERTSSSCLPHCFDWRFSQGNSQLQPRSTSRCPGQCFLTCLVGLFFPGPDFSQIRWANDHLLRCFSHCQVGSLKLYMPFFPLRYFNITIEIIVSQG